MITLFYWFFWLFIPLLGYSWFFSWRFVDGVVEQEMLFQDANRPPINDVSAKAVHVPFTITVYLGLACWLGGFLFGGGEYAYHLRRIQSDPAYRQAAYIRATAAQAATRQQNTQTLQWILQRNTGQQPPRQGGAEALV